MKIPLPDLHPAKLKNTFLYEKHRINYIKYIVEENLLILLLIG